MTDSTTDIARDERPDWLSVQEFPFVGRWVDLDGHRVHYIDQGSGPTLLMVHPGPVWSFIFRDLVLELQSDFRCVVLDFPGTGLSPVSDGYQPSLAGASRILHEFGQRVVPDGAILLLHDTGGAAGLAVANRHPEWVKGLVLCSTFGWPLSDVRPIARMLRFLSGRIFGVLDDVFNIVGRITASRLGAGRNLSAVGKRVLARPFAVRSARQRARAILRDILDADGFLRHVETRSRLNAVRWPVLLAYTSMDPGRFQSRFAEIFPQARTKMFQGRHFPFADQPAEFATAIREWWRTEGTSAGVEEE